MLGSMNTTDNFLPLHVIAFLLCGCVMIAKTLVACNVNICSKGSCERLNMLFPHNQPIFSIRTGKAHRASWLGGMFFNVSPPISAPCAPASRHKPTAKQTRCAIFNSTHGKESISV